MAILWLYAVAPLFRPAPKVNAELRLRVKRNLERWATWPAEGSAVLWTDRPAGAGIRDTDCIVYFVPTYREGVIVGRTRRDPQLAGLHYAMLQQLNLGDPTHLSATIPDPPAMSEVWAGDIIRWIRESKAASAIWSELELERVSYALAIACYHEAMHNKVEPAKGDDWDLHDNGGGDAALPLARRAVEKKLPPNIENRRLLGTFLGSRRRQYVHQSGPVA
jgi:hypothetical protein